MASHHQLPEELLLVAAKILPSSLWSLQCSILAIMSADQGTTAVKPRRKRLSTAHARRRARVYSSTFKRELHELNDEGSADELRRSRESSLGNGSAVFLRGLLSETDGAVRGISNRYETQREVSKRV